MTSKAVREAGSGVSGLGCVEWGLMMVESLGISMSAAALGFTWDASHTWIVVIGALCAMACALLGNFLVLRRMSMMGDAISHAVLPGLAGGFLLMVWLKGSPTVAAMLPGVAEWAQGVDSRNPWVMLGGAVVVGVLTTLLTQWVHAFGKVERGAAMGVVFTTLFAVGLIMIQRAASHTHLDADCVLHGALELAPWDTWDIGALRVPRAVVILGVILLINATFVALFFKELKISSFDPDLATTMGINAKLMHYLLMTLVAITTVASFETIGSILVIAMLIVPAAAAHLLTDRLPTMIVVSLVFAALSALLGHVAAHTVPTWFGYGDTVTSGMMAVMAGVLFGLVMLFAPRHGVAARVVRQWLLRVRIAREDVLGLLYRLEERAGRGMSNVESQMAKSESRKSKVEGSGGSAAAVVIGPTPMATIARALHLSGLTRWWAAATLRREGMVEQSGDGLRLTEQGRDAARGLVRTHRLWESYLHQELALPVDHVHAPAERLEHVTDDEMQQRLATATDRPEYDPQGKRVPPAGDGDSSRHTHGRQDRE